MAGTNKKYYCYARKQIEISWIPLSYGINKFIYMIIIVIFIVIPNVIVVVYIPGVYLHKILVSFGKRRRKKGPNTKAYSKPC